MNKRTMPIEWHEHNATNNLISLANMKMHIELAKEQYETQEKQVDFYLFQIAEAKRLNKKEFDRDKFRIKK